MKRHFIKAFAFSCAIAGTAIPAFITEAAPPMADNAVCFYSAFPNGSNHKWSEEIVSQQRFYVFKENGKEGLINSSGNIIVPAINYDEIYNINTKFITVKNGKKYGILNLQGGQILPATYDSISVIKTDGLSPVQNNIFKVKQGKKYGLFNAQGKQILACEYKDINYENGIITAIKDKQTYNFSINGTPLPLMLSDKDLNLANSFLNQQTSISNNKDKKNIKAEYILPSGNGYYYAKFKNKYSFYDSNFNLVNEVKADSFTRLDNGLFAITRKKSGLSLGGLLSTAIAFGTGTPLYPGQVNWMRSNIKTGYLDNTGTEIIPTKNDYNGTFFEGHALVMVKDKFGYVDTAGNYLVPAEFDDISAFSFYDPDIVVVEKDDDYGFYDTKKGLFTSGYTAASNFVNGLAPIAITENKWGYIDRLGNKVIRPKFDMVTPFFDENAMTKINGYYRIINKNGDTVANLQTAEEAGALKDGSAPIKIDGKWGIISDNGTMLVEPVYKDLKIFNDFDSYFYNYQE